MGRRFESSPADKLIIICFLLDDMKTVEGFYGKEGCSDMM
jgi:hypothetical protein